MERDLYHSSEGQTWRKHKYIRKEGNRYIYPEDLRSNNEAARKATHPAYNRKPARDVISRSGVKTVEKYVSPDGYSFRIKSSVDKYGRQHELDEDNRSLGDHHTTEARRRATVYRKAFDREDRSNQFSEKKQSSINRVSSKNSENSHKLVANGGKAEHTKKQLNDSHDQAKKDVSKLNTSGFVAMHQPKDFDKNGNPKRWRSTVNMNREAEAKAEDRFKKNAKTAVPASVQDQKRSVRMDERRRNSSNQMPESDRRKESELAKAKRDENARKSGNQAVKNAKNAQERAKNAKGKVSKDYAQELAYNSQKNDGSSKATVKNSKNVETLDNQTVKKSTNNQKGHFTLSENGETIFVPDDKKTEKRVSKGKQIVDKIKSAFRKKKK